MRILWVHSSPLLSQVDEILGGAELEILQRIATAPSGVAIDVILPDAPASLNSYDTVILSNLRPMGGLGEKAETKWAEEWILRLKRYRGQVVRLEHDVHPCTHRDARCIDYQTLKVHKRMCDSPIPGVFKRLYNLCNIVFFLSPLHQKVVNLIIRISGPRQYLTASPIDFDLFQATVPIIDRRHAALVLGDAMRVAPEAVSLAEAEGFQVDSLEYLTVPYAEMPALFNQYKAVVVAPVMLHAFGRIAVEAMACGCRIIANDRVGALSWKDPVAASRDSSSAFWKAVVSRDKISDIHTILKRRFF